MDRISLLHEDLNHASPEAMIRTVKSDDTKGTAKAHRLGVTVAQIELWKRVRGAWCKGCIRGKVVEHSHKPSSRTEVYELGEVAGGDLMFIEVKDGEAMKPLLVTVDLATQLSTVTALKDKSAEAILEGLAADQAIKRGFGKPIKTLLFDREPGIIALNATLKEELGITLEPKAAGQHVGQAERHIRLLKDHCRATKLGVLDKYGYLPPSSWNLDLVLDVNSFLNTIVKDGKQASPFELFTGKPPDRVKGLRGLPWGAIVLTKPPKLNNTANVTNPKADYSVVVRRLRDRAGVIKVYQVETGKFAYRLQAKKVAEVPEWVLNKLRAVNPNTTIGYEDDSFSHEDLINPTNYTEPEPGPSLTDEEMKIMKKAAHGALEDEDEQDVLQDVLERVLEEPQFSPGHGINSVDEEGLLTPYHDTFDGEPQPTAGDTNFLQTETMERRYPVRNRHPPVRYPAPESYYVYAMTYAQAKKERPEKAIKAMDTELDNWHRNEGWKPVHYRDLTEDQRKLIINGLDNFVEKYDQHGVHIKDKVRVLVNGSQQMNSLTGETHGAVCRIESLMLILQLAVIKRGYLFRIDVVAAFLKTKMNDDVKHKWVRLSKDVSQRLVERWPERYAEFLDKNGRVLVEMLKIGYGYREAGHYFGELMKDVLSDIGMIPCASDTCVWTYRKRDKWIDCGTTVDDVCGAADSEDTALWLHKEIESRVEEATIEKGDDITWVGMQVTVTGRESTMQIELCQHKFIKDAVNEYNVKTTVPTPATTNLYDIDPDSPLLSDQRIYMSAVATAAFAANRTVPQIKVAVHFCATRFGKATEEDWRKIMRVYSYLNRIKEDQRIILNAVSVEKVIATADSAYAVDKDCKSTSAGCIGFPGIDGKTSYFLWVHKTQPIATRSSSESELVAASYIVEYGLWVTYMLDELGFGKRMIELEQDNTSSISFVKRGRGTFSRTKHIKVRWFWITMLMEDGELSIKHVPTQEMTADILSKPLPYAAFLKLLFKLVGWRPEADA